MISKELQKAREYEREMETRISPEERPLFHFSPRVGWLNDPNGFSWYEGQVHLFYQYHPYDTYWGPMHWGHAVSEDLIRWRFWPAAMAPDQAYDDGGCFSGSALTLPDGRHLLMYTGCCAEEMDAEGRWMQVQCIAVREGSEYRKYEGNPVITGEDLPEGGDPYEFRDPYIWKTSDGYRAIIGNANESGATQLCLYRSRDGFHWEFGKVLYEDEERIGVMWECPSFFELDGKQILMSSPMDMEAEEANGSVRFPKGNNVCYLVGTYDEKAESFTPQRAASSDSPSNPVMKFYHPVDCGLDFYAPQVTCLPDGRRVMIGWMQDPSNGNYHEAEEFRIFGQMTIPRELRLADGRLIQRPVKELDAYRAEPGIRGELLLESGPVTIPGLQGRIFDLRLSVRPERVTGTGDASLQEFRMRFAESAQFYTELVYRPDSSVLTIDRSHAGMDPRITTKRSVRIRDRGGQVDLRILLDRWSAEVFVNDGEQVMSVTLYTPKEADGISFQAEGSAILTVEANELAVPGQASANEPAGSARTAEQVLDEERR